jgi:hypothetical protein
MTGPALVEAIRTIIGDRRAATTRDVLAALAEKGTTLDPRSLASALRPYGVRPRTVRLPGASATPKGYVRDSFHPGEPRRQAADDLGDLAAVEHDDGSIADALPAEPCRCPRPVADEGDCFRCGRLIAHGSR